MEEIGPLNSVAVVLGAGTFPKAKERLSAPPSFEKSACGFRDYLTAADGYGLPGANLLNLFDSSESPGDQCVKVVEFLSAQPPSISDLIVYYVGHGHVPGADLCLALRGTDDRFFESTSLKVRDLAIALRTGPHRLRIYVILDCCFSASGVKDFMGVETTVAMTKAAFPLGGVGVLCSTSASAVSLAPDDLEYTLFSGVLLDVLKAGSREWPRRLSLRHIGAAARQLITERHSARPVLPQVHSPDSSDGDVAMVGLFPNAARRTTGALAALAGLTAARRTTGALAALAGLTDTLEAAERQIASLVQQVRQLQEIAANVPATHSTAQFKTHLVLEPDGSATVERECSGITATQVITDLEVPYSLWLSQGTLGEPVVERMSPSRFEVSFVPRPGAPRSDRAVDGFVRISGELSENSGFVGYRVRQEVRQGFYTTKEAAEAAYVDDLWKGEYFGSITYVKQYRMEIRVDFPPQWRGCVATACPLVFIGESEVVDEEEIDVVQPGFRTNGRTVTLSVDNPKRGNHYVVAWTPPPRG